MLLIKVFLVCSLFVLWTSSFAMIVTKGLQMKEDLQLYVYSLNLRLQEAAPLWSRNIQGFDI